MRPTGQAPAVAPGPVTGPPPLPEASAHGAEGEVASEMNVVGDEIPILATAETAAGAAEPRLSDVIEATADADEADAEVANGDDDR
jgi:hypothetical protein